MSREARTHRDDVLGVLRSKGAFKCPCNRIRCSRQKLQQPCKILHLARYTRSADISIANDVYFCCTCATVPRTTAPGNTCDNNKKTIPINLSSMTDSYRKGA